MNANDGIASFQTLVLQAIPGVYTVSVGVFSGYTTNALAPVKVSVNVRSCILGEVVSRWVGEQAGRRGCRLGRGAGRQAGGQAGRALIILYGNNNDNTTVVIILLILNYQ